MPSNRPNLILDEQAFQGLLCAAFIVQEYNDRLNNDRPRSDRLSNNRLNNDQLNSAQLKPARPKPAEPEARPTPESHGICGHCGAPKPAEKSGCESCGREEFRPGERLQRNWASMWLMSQEQDLWPAHSPETRDSARKDIPTPVVGRPLPDSARESASSGLVAQPVSREIAGQGKIDTVIDTIKDQPAGKSARGKTEPGKSALDEPILDEPTFDQPTLHPVHDDQGHGNLASHAQALHQTEAVSKPTTAAIDEAIEEAMDETAEPLTQEEFAHEETDLAVHTFRLSATDDASPIEASTDESVELESAELMSGASDSIHASDRGNRSLLQHLADLRVTLRFQRSNLYLVGAVFVAALALLWPTASSPRRAALGPWERALVTLGLAEAPEPAIHLQGDPGLQVWVDPHSALYYCPGEEQYGKTADGRFTSQREAQMERFEPASRSACE